MDENFWNAVLAGGVVGAIGGLIGDWLWAGLICAAFVGVVLSVDPILRRFVDGAQK